MISNINLRPLHPGGGGEEAIVPGRRESLREVRCYPARRKAAGTLEKTILALVKKNAECTAAPSQ